MKLEIKAFYFKYIFKLIILLDSCIVLRSIVPFGTSKVVANLSKIYPKDMEAPAGGVDDMTKLSYLHEPGVLQNLKIRYELNEIYVSFPSRCFNLIKFPF